MSFNLCALSRVLNFSYTILQFHLGTETHQANLALSVGGGFSNSSYSLSLLFLSICLSFLLVILLLLGTSDVQETGNPTRTLDRTKPKNPPHVVLHCRDFAPNLISNLDSTHVSVASKSLTYTNRRYPLKITTNNQTDKTGFHDHHPSWLRFRR